MGFPFLLFLHLYLLLSFSHSSDYIYIIIPLFFTSLFVKPNICFASSFGQWCLCKMLLTLKNMRNMIKSHPKGKRAKKKKKKKKKKTNLIHQLSTIPEQIARLVYFFSYFYFSFFLSSFLFLLWFLHSEADYTHLNGVLPAALCDGYSYFYFVLFCFILFCFYYCCLLTSIIFS